MTPTRLFVQLVIFLCVLSSLECKKGSPVGPSQPSSPDSTSHNISWQSYSLDGGSGVEGASLYDVSIINDSLILAVGEVYFTDSTTGVPDPRPYNLAEWNGTSWSLRKVAVATPYGSATTPIYGIFSFSATDIWLLAGFPVHGDGTTWNEYDLVNMGILTQNDGYIRGAWGSSSKDMYFIGTKGTIVHYDGTNWKKIQTGTALDMQAIWGGYDQKTSEYQILALASNPFTFPEGKLLLQLNGSTATAIADSGLAPSLMGLWFIPSECYYIVGDGIYQKSILGDPMWSSLPLLTTFYTSNARGNSPIDVFIVGSFGECLHWNGKSWRSFFNVTGLENGAYSQVAVKGNIVAAAGSNNATAVVLIGRRAN